MEPTSKEPHYCTWWIIIIFFCHCLCSPLGPWPLIFSFMIILQTVGLLGRVISSSQGLYLNTGQHKHRINIFTHQTFILWVGFKPTISASERAKTVQVLDRSATVNGIIIFTTNIIVIFIMIINKCIIVIYYLFYIGPIIFLCEAYLRIFYKENNYIMRKLNLQNISPAKRK
jgi:hypothetical protein